MFAESDWFACTKKFVDHHNAQKLRTNDREIAHLFLKINLREAELDLVPG